MHCSTDYVVVCWILSDLCVNKIVCDAWWREQSAGVAPPSAGVDALVSTATHFILTRVVSMLFLCLCRFELTVDDTIESFSCPITHLNCRAITPRLGFKPKLYLFICV